MSRRNSERLPSSNDLRNLLSAGLPLALNITQAVMEMKQEENRQLEERRARLMKERLILRKQDLINKITIYMDANGSNTHIEALLAQILVCSFNDVVKYEQIYNELYCTDLPSPVFIRPSQATMDLSTSMLLGAIRPTNIMQLFELPMSASSASAMPIMPTQTINEAEKKVSVTYKDFKREADNSTCTICLEKYKDSDEIEIRHCSHSFHKECLASWEKSGRTNGKLCPCCRH